MEPETILLHILDAAADAAEQGERDPDGSLTEEAQARVADILALADDPAALADLVQ